ncbi:zinc-dependent alcohol dehydrogenase family protein [Piscinibacter sp.]|uniref:zinc-dependent alcohol dehydrogenase family protein n=1 Tax=Piscinibacter sp. TaxID=1903157 RepID=UPI0035598412
MALIEPASHVLQPIERELRPPGPQQLLLRVLCCGVCRTDLHIVDGELPTPQLPRVPGHEVVGVVAALGEGCRRFRLGERVGVPWLYDTCGACPYCASGRENLCGRALFTGLSVDGGYAEAMLANESHCFALPERYSDEQAAPLLCAGLIGYRALRMAGDAAAVGIYGFGAAGHLVAQVALAQGRTVYAFTRAGDEAAQALARSLGVHWAGASNEAPPHAMDAAILFAPAGELVPQSLQHVVAGGTVVCAGIHMSDIPRFAYRLLWGERCVRSVANLTRRDGNEFFAWAAAHPLTLHTESFALRDANEALARLRGGRIVGAAVLRCAPA